MNKYCGNCPFPTYSIEPGMIVIPLLVPANPSKAERAPPKAPANNERTNGLRNRKFTPKITGSVIPRNADKAAGNVNAFNFGLFVLTPIATAAAP